MSEPIDSEETDEWGYSLVGRRKARATLSQAAAEMADSHENSAGAIVTGYVFVAELTVPDGRFCMWLTGNGGQPDEDHTEGLDSWRVEGLVRKVLRDIYDKNVSDD